MIEFAGRVSSLVVSALIATTSPAFAQQQGGGDAPPPAVTVQTLEARDVTLTSMLPGRVVASGVAEVRPQVNGIIIERLFEEGADVEVGDPLYRIDDAVYRAAVASARAEVARADAAYRAASREEERVKVLIERGVASEQSYDQALAESEGAAAQLEVAKAELQAAQIDAEHTVIRAPLSGVIGRSLTTQGALVNAGQGEPLAVIRTLDPVLVDVTQSAAEIIAWRRDGGAERLGAARKEVELTLADGLTYDKTGSLTVAEPNVNELTGVVTLRLQFQNDQRLLLPGMYVQVALPQGVVENAIAVPQEAVSRDRRGRPVTLVVNADNVVESRDLTIVQALDSDWIVSSGVEDGERVIVAGVQKAQAGATVAPEERDTDGGGESAPAKQARAAADAPTAD